MVDPNINYTVYLPLVIAIINTFGVVFAAFYSKTTHTAVNSRMDEFKVTLTKLSEARVAEAKTTGRMEAAAVIGAAGIPIAPTAIPPLDISEGHPT